MKKIIILISTFLMINNAQTFADEHSDESAKIREIATTNSQFAEDESEVSIDEALNKAQGSIAKSGFAQSFLYSNNPADLDPMRGTIWSFTYTIYTTTFTDTIRFGTTTEYASDGTVGLSASNQFDSTGYVFFGDSSIGQAFACGIEGSMLFDVYTFQVNGTTATGTYKFKDLSTGEYSNTYSMSGTKISDSTTTSTSATTTTTAPSFCPMAVIYGEDSEQIEMLRNYRDDVLSQTSEGCELIKLYYLWSPAIVRAMEQDEEFKHEIKWIIDSILPMIAREME